MMHSPDIQILGCFRSTLDEIPVTYLFYELQRRFRVSERIHQVMPVILVAQEFPKPSHIDEDWKRLYNLLETSKVVWPEG
jgi:hypothetical protein